MVARFGLGQAESQTVDEGTWGGEQPRKGAWAVPEGLWAEGLGSSCGTSAH